MSNDTQSAPLVHMDRKQRKVIVPLIDGMTTEVFWADVVKMFNVQTRIEHYPKSHKVTVKLRDGQEDMLFYTPTSVEALELRRLVSNAQKGVFPAKPEPSPEPEQFKKNDGDKPDLDMIPPVLGGVARVMAIGAEKYGRGNYMTCKPEERHRYRSALMRHNEAYRAGETHDESGEHHLAHVAANALILIALEEQDGRD